MAQASATPLPVPRESERITVRTTGNVMGELRHEEAGPGDQRALYTEGISSCKVLATYTPGGRRTLLHANGGEFTNEYLQSLAANYITANTTVIVANGNVAGSRSFFEDEVAEVGQKLNVYLRKARKQAQVNVVASWADTDGANASTFVLRHDGVYGRCNAAGAGVGVGSKKRWYFCGCC